MPTVCGMLNLLESDPTVCLLWETLCFLLLTRGTGIYHRGYRSSLLTGYCSNCLPGTGLCDRVSERYSYFVLLLIFAVCCMVNRELVSSITGLMCPSSTLSYVKGNRIARIYFLNIPLVTFFILSATQ